MKQKEESWRVVRQCWSDITDSEPRGECVVRFCFNKKGKAISYFEITFPLCLHMNAFF